MSINPTRICVPVCATTELEFEQNLRRAASVADVVELRLDCLEPAEFEKLRHRLAELVESIERPVILTFRPAEQGGFRDLNREERLGFWTANRLSDAEYYDIESDLACDEKLFKQETTGNWSRTICSYHNFVGAPEDLEQIYETIFASKARILKIAVQANDVTDCLPVFQLLERARERGREIIALAMGEAGIITRILGPSRGTFLTYAALSKGSGTAEGQLTVRDLKETYRIEKISKQTQIVGLVGLPTAHSISPHVHNAAFEATRVDGAYLRFDVRDLKSFIEKMVHPRSRELDWNVRGLSITAPHKTAVMDQLDEIDPAAREIGAVNTVVVSADVLKGYNTDAEGFIQPLREKIGQLSGLRCAVIGAGGAARTAAWVLRREGASTKIFARQPESAEKLALEFDSEWEQLGETRFDGFDVVINATPMGTAGTLETESVVNAAQLRGARLVYDLVYNPKETRLMREAREVGCETLGGASMLVTQAAAQFKLWTSLDAPIEVMAKAAEKALARDV